MLCLSFCRTFSEQTAFLKQALIETRSLMKCEAFTTHHHVNGHAAGTAPYSRLTNSAMISFFLSKLFPRLCSFWRARVSLAWIRTYFKVLLSFFSHKLWNSSKSAQTGFGVLLTSRVYIQDLLIFYIHFSLISLALIIQKL